MATLRSSFLDVGGVPRGQIGLGVAATQPRWHAGGIAAQGAAGQDRWQVLRNAHPGMRVAPGIAKQYKPNRKAAVNALKHNR
jgi:hypothetical protein